MLIATFLKIFQGFLLADVEEDNLAWIACDVLLCGGKGVGTTDK